MSQWARYRREIGDRWLATRLALAGRQHQYPEILALRRFIRHFGVNCVIDVGANAGQYATMLRKDVGFAGTILSFEPNPAVFAALERRASGDPRWHCHNVALSDADGTAVFNIMAAGTVGALAYTFTDSFWFSAVEGEVYAMSSLFTASRASFNATSTARRSPSETLPPCSLSARSVA